MITQNIALGYLMPIALEYLEDNPFAAGDYYPGDLLNSVLSVNREFWESNQELYWMVYEITRGVLEAVSNVDRAIRNFENRRLGS